MAARRTKKAAKRKAPKPKAEPKPRAGSAAAQWTPTKSLVPWAGNPRVNDHAVDAVARSIRELGFGAPIVAQAGTRRIIAGHTRHKAAVKLRLAHVPVRFLACTDEQATTMTLADNKLGELATWDTAELGALLVGLEDELRGVVGFTDEDMQAIIGAFAVGPDGVMPDLPTHSGIQTMTFTLTDVQAGVVKAALKRAKAAGPFSDTGNINAAGNALARMSEAYRGEG